MNQTEAEHVIAELKRELQETRVELCRQMNARITQLRAESARLRAEAVRRDDDEEPDDDAPGRVYLGLWFDAPRWAQPWNPEDN